MVGGVTDLDHVRNVQNSLQNRSHNDNIVHVKLNNTIKKRLNAQETQNWHQRDS